MDGTFQGFCFEYCDLFWGICWNLLSKYGDFKIFLMIWELGVIYFIFHFVYLWVFKNDHQDMKFFEKKKNFKISKNIKKI
jgi:hypothetical protein